MTRLLAIALVVGSTTLVQAQSTQAEKEKIAQVGVPPVAEEPPVEDQIPMRPQLAAHFMMGLGGKAGNAQLDPTLGALLAYEHPLHKYFVLGGGLGLHSWVTQQAARIGIGRDLLFDIYLQPKARIPFGPQVEIFLAVPVGFSMNFAAAPGLDTGLGMNVAALFGGQLALTESFGLIGELGYGYHWISHNLGDTNIGQFVITAGLFVRL